MTFLPVLALDTGGPGGPGDPGDPGDPGGSGNPPLTTPYYPFTNPTQLIKSDLVQYFVDIHTYIHFKFKT